MFRWMLAGLGAVVCASLAMTATPALATATIFCDGVEDDSVSLSIGVGRVPVLAVLNVLIEADGTLYANDTTAHPDATPIIFGQGYTDANRVRIDFTDPNVEEILISLRLERAFEDKAGAEAGILRVIGVGAYAVVCETG